MDAANKIAKASAEPEVARGPRESRESRSRFFFGGRRSFFFRGTVREKSSGDERPEERDQRRESVIRAHVSGQRALLQDAVERPRNQRGEADQRGRPAGVDGPAGDDDQRQNPVAAQHDRREPGKNALVKNAGPRRNIAEGDGGQREAKRDRGPEQQFFLRQDRFFLRGEILAQRKLPEERDGEQRHGQMESGVLADRQQQDEDGQGGFLFFKGEGEQEGAKQDRNPNFKMGVVQDFGRDAVEGDDEGDRRGGQGGDGFFQRRRVGGEEVGGGDENQGGVKREGGGQERGHVFAGLQRQDFSGVGERDEERRDMDLKVGFARLAEDQGVGEFPVGVGEHSGEPSAVQHGDGFLVVCEQDEVSGEPEDGARGGEESGEMGGGDFHSGNYSGGINPIPSGLAGAPGGCGRRLQSRGRSGRAGCRGPGRLGR